LQISTRATGGMAKTRLLTVLVVVAALAWEFLPIPLCIWDGGYVLTVRVSHPEASLRAVNCQLCWGREEADEVQKLLLPPEVSAGSFSRVEPFRSEPLNVNVQTSGVVSPWAGNCAITNLDTWWSLAKSVRQCGPARWWRFPTAGSCGT
jgi:hypothetical protein